MSTPQLPSGAQATELTSRVERFCAYLDRELGLLPRKERLAHLRRQAAWWEAARERFFHTIDVEDLDPPPDGPDATEYLLIIGAIDERILRERS